MGEQREVKDNGQKVRVVSSSHELLKSVKDALNRAGIQHTSQLLSRPRRKALKDEKVRPLTNREMKVLQTVSDLGTIAATAQELTISPKTVQTHLAHIRLKTDVTTTVEAVAWAWRRGLLE